MGSLGDDENDDKVEENNKSSIFQLDISDTDTEILDSQPSPSVIGEYGSFDYTVPLEDAETQVVCLGGETQVLNFDGETQAVDNLDHTGDFGTQLFDDRDTEVVGDSDDEETKRTEVLSDTEELSDVDSVKKVGSHPSELENVLQTTLHKQNDGECKEVQTIEECKRGTVIGGFTSLRVASMRSSGLAARDTALKRTNSKSCSNISDSQHDAEQSGTSVTRDSLKFLEQFDQRHNPEEHDNEMKEPINKNKCRAGKSAVRKLFNEDISYEREHDNNMNITDEEAELPPLFTSENEIAGLSYVDSQDPGEASQTIALDFVDKFLKVNVTEFDQEAEIKKSTGGKSKLLSGAKGTQNLAKRANRICSPSGGIFDWDDNQEDEGGGAFFRKKKEAFFDNGHKSFTQPRDSKSLNLKNCWAVKGNTDKVHQQDIANNVTDLVYSDSKLLLHKQKKNNKLTKFVGESIGKNLIKDLNNSRDEMGPKNDDPDISNVGPDTQLAAEAMEALCDGVGMTKHNNDVANQDPEIHLSSSPSGNPRKTSQANKHYIQEKVSHTSESGVLRRQRSETKNSGPRLGKRSSILSENHSVKIRKQCHETGDLHNVHSELIDKIMNGKDSEKGGIEETDRYHVAASIGQKTVKRRCVQEQLGNYSPVASRTRKKALNQTVGDIQASDVLREGIDNLTGPKRKRSRIVLDELAGEKITDSKFIQPGKHKEADLARQSDSKLSGTSTSRKGKLRRRLSKEEETNGESNTKIKVSRVNSGIKMKTRSSGVCGPALRSSERQSGKSWLGQSPIVRRAKDTSMDHNPTDQNGNAVPKHLAEVKTPRKSQSAISPAEELEANPQSEASEKGVCTPCAEAFMTPSRCTTPINEASPICMGDEYRSCRKNLLKSSLQKEVSRLIADGLEPTYKYKDLRKRRDITQVYVLFSHHLDGDIIKQQKKVLARLGASVASSISDATHFVTDKFVRTRNMLEAIAYGKPVVTHFWLESCAQASCLIDERNYILRDAKKEKELGFSLPVSLARACEHPLLEGRKVLITRNTKPGKDILSSLVKAVHGMAVERIGRSAVKDDRTPDDLIVLSCEEDYADCVPFLEKGATVYSSELLLNGIVIQKMEFERHRIFADNIRKTRSTIWLRKDGEEYTPVAKCK